MSVNVALINSKGINALCRHDRCLICCVADSYSPASGLLSSKLEELIWTDSIVKPKYEQDFAVCGGWKDDSSPPELSEGWANTADHTSYQNAYVFVILRHHNTHTTQRFVVRVTQLALHV